MPTRLHFNIPDEDGPAPDLIVQFIDGRVTIELEVLEDLNIDYGIPRERLVAAINKGTLDNILTEKRGPHQDARIGVSEMALIIQVISE